MQRWLIRGSIPARAGETSETPVVATLRQVHPRACGGNFTISPSATPCARSIPRVRGKHHKSRLEDQVYRSIPARAGETKRGVTAVACRGVHPRACGGNQGGETSATCGRGPSPRVRGKPIETTIKGGLPGSIPARAGETTFISCNARMSRVHPRACGGNGATVIVADRFKGPSPRVRGKRCEVGARPGQERSIPARAGETAGWNIRYGDAGVHPRACGGNHAIIEYLNRLTGPSPRVRGKHPLGDRSAGRDGSIPARAGETSTVSLVSASPWVHPRACGGNQHRELGERVPMGSIPARAGETSRSVLARCSWRVHPRACGGNHLQPRDWRSRPGPSPRVRGKHGRGRGLGRCGRSIPARAGETSGQRAWHGGSGVHPRRVRGKLRWKCHEHRTPGSIPARAGETGKHLTTPHSVYGPSRACGGNCVWIGMCESAGGPSPRVRGKPTS